MKKLHAFAFYALVTPVLTFGAGSLLAQSADQDMDHEQQSTQLEQDATQSTPRTMQSDQSTEHTGMPDAPTAADRQENRDQYAKMNRGFMNSAPANSMQASDLIGAEVKTTGDENVGPVDELLIDESGQVVAIVVGVGGFLGIGEKNVAIGWDDVTISGGTSGSDVDADEPDLRIDLTRDDLRTAPEFEEKD